jgi:putative ABC transport system permease protein
VTGGAIGIALGYALSFGVALAIPGFPTPAVPWWAIVGSCAFATLIGLFFGIWPASKAADLTPIEALRYE